MTTDSRTGLQLRSTVRKDGLLVLSLAEVPIAEPKADEVLVRIEASPINPSDLGVLLAGADMTTAKASGTADRPIVTATIAPEMMRALAGRIPQPIVLHGASSMPQEGIALAERYGAKLPHAQGIPPELIRQAIALGIAKVNTDSDLRLAAIGRLRQVLTERPDVFNLYELMGEVETAIRDETALRIQMLGSNGKA